MKIKIDVTLKDLKGNPLNDADGTELKLGNVVANILSQEKSDGIKPMKAYLKAQEFATKDEVELDKDDMNKIIAAVEASVRFTPLVVGQIVEYLTDQKE